MADLTGAEIESLVIGLVLALGFIGVAFYALKWLRLRSTARTGGPPRPEVASDRAYNRLAMARRESELLERQGLDVARARDLIALADRTFREREFDRAYELAQSAHESLVTLRRQAGGGSPRPAPPRTPSEPLAVATGAVADPAPAVPRPGPAPATSADALPPGRLPKNKLESQFQLKLFEQELERSKVDGRPHATAAVDEVSQQARGAFDQGDYTEALRLALRGRRMLGGSVETLGPSHPAGGAPPPAPIGPGVAPAAGGPAEAVTKIAGGERCSNCGHPVTPGDTFCRGCGVPHRPTACPRCGAPRTPADTFCGKCGFRYG